ncbi:MAG: hypothetical protein GY841_18475 [FCB group bacterium]|nr:hypothetical protein [FCB group bacterium]
MFIQRVILVMVISFQFCAVHTFAQDPGELDTLRLSGGPLVLDESRALTLTIVNDQDLGGFSGALIMGSIDGGMAVFDSVIYVNRMENPEVFESRLFELADAQTIKMAFSHGFSTYIDFPPGNSAMAYVYLTGTSLGEMVIDSGYCPPVFDFLFFLPSGAGFKPQYPPFTVSVVEEAPPTCGDANGDGPLNVGDAVYLINYVFKNGAAPNPLCSGDANGDGSINVGDAVYMINYVFKSGNPPIEPCCP